MPENVGFLVKSTFYGSEIQLAPKSVHVGKHAWIFGKQVIARAVPIVGS